MLETAGARQNMKHPPCTMKPNISDDPAELRRRAEAASAASSRKSEVRADPNPTPTPSGCSTNWRSTRLNWRCRTRNCGKPGMNWRCCWRNTPTSTISRRWAISPLMNGRDQGGEPDWRRFARRGTVPADQPALGAVLWPDESAGLSAFLKKVFTEPKDQVCEAQLLKEGGGTFWASFRGTSAVSLKGTRKWCRVAFGDITARKQAEEVQRRVEALADANRGLNREIARRQTVEKSLKKSEQSQRPVAGAVATGCRNNCGICPASFCWRRRKNARRISRELHDEIAQTLTGINVRLAALKRRGRDTTPRASGSKISSTQRMVEKSVDIVHRFARELRPAVLDDLGLVPALHSFMKEFTKRTGVHIRFDDLYSAG